YKYGAHSLKYLHLDEDFIQSAVSDVEGNDIKYLCLIFNQELLKKEAEKNLMSLNIDNNFFDRWSPETLLDNIIENSRVVVDTWTRKRPGNDDSWGANYISNFGIYNDKFHSYLKKFAFHKVAFHDSAYASCYTMIDKYILSSEFKE